MKTYSSLYHSVLLRKMEKARKYYEDLTNQMFGKVIVDQNRFISQFHDNLKKILGNSYKSYNSSASIYISAPGLLTEAEKRLRMHDSKEIAVIDIAENKIMFKRKGRNSWDYKLPSKPYSQYTKVIKFGRELTPEKAARYILRFGTK